MFIQLKNNNLDTSFLQELTKITQIHNIQDWFIIYKNMNTSLDHNGTYSIDSLYVLSHENLKEVVIYFAQMDNGLNSYKTFEKLSFNDFLSYKINKDVMNNISKNYSEIHHKTKNFQSFILANKLETHLSHKNICDKKLKL